MFLDSTDIIKLAITEAELSPLQVEMVRYFYLRDMDEWDRDIRGTRIPPTVQGFKKPHPAYRVPGKGRLRKPTGIEVQAELDAALSKIRARMYANDFDNVADVLPGDGVPSGKHTGVKRAGGAL